MQKVAFSVPVLNNNFIRLIVAALVHAAFCSFLLGLSVYGIMKVSSTEHWVFIRSLLVVLIIVHLSDWFLPFNLFTTSIYRVFKFQEYRFRVKIKLNIWHVAHVADEEIADIAVALLLFGTYARDIRYFK